MATARVVVLLDHMLPAILGWCRRLGGPPSSPTTLLQMCAW